MPTYLSPGVYVEEVPPSARPISGVGTSTAGFLGVVANDVPMPLRPGRTEADPPKPEDHYELARAGQPKQVTSWEEFRTRFGDFHDKNRILAHAVYGFFNNGGTRCWVQRVADATDLDDPAAELEAFEAIDEIAVVAIPGATSQQQHGALIAHCEKLKDRVAILDGGASADLTTGEIRPVGRSSVASYAALYFPQINVYDPVQKKEADVPPSGHIAGIYARSDASRGVFKAPANEPVIGALNVSRRISHPQQETLNPEGINVLRIFDGTATVWGARTMADDGTAQFRYVSVRRYFNFLRESIMDGTRWVVFEPNSPPLWQRITRNVGDFLLGQWRDGALFGDTPAQAFYVRCDATTNPPDVRELGHVVTEVGVAIVKPAEFVIFRVEQLTGG
jgi:phage tail sheath protein FI